MRENLRKNGPRRNTGRKPVRYRKPVFCGNSGAKPGGEEEEPPVFMRELPPQGVEKWIWEIFMTVSVLLLLAALFLAFRLGRMDLAVVLMGIAALTGVGVFVFWIVSRRKKAAKEGKIWEPKEAFRKTEIRKTGKEKVVKEEKLPAAQENGYPDRERHPQVRSLWFCRNLVSARKVP